MRILFFYANRTSTDGISTEIFNSFSMSHLIQLQVKQNLLKNLRIFCHPNKSAKLFCQTSELNSYYLKNLNLNK